jgi:dTDP-4-dehydrorhamnose reductase
MCRILVLGGSGLIGTAIINEMRKYNKFEVYSTYFQNPQLLNRDRNFKLNIEDSDDINIILNTIKPRNVISCLRGDFDIQLILHEKIAEYLKENGGNLYFFSSMNVFDNNLCKPHYEDDLPNSHTDYGQYKIECEKRITEILYENACILRLPQVWGRCSPRMSNLLNLLYNNKSVTVYPRLLYNANTDVMIAKQLICIIDNNLKGIFHLVPEDVVNYKDFYNVLITGLCFKNAVLEENFEEEGYLSLLSKRSNEFPEELRFSNESVINYLTN